MIGQLTVRCRPQKFESLTGYMFRLAELNGVQFADIVRVSGTKYRKTNHLRLAYQLDRFPSRISNIATLSQLTQVNQNSLEAMTFHSLYRKLYDDPDEKSEWRSNIIASSLIRNIRRFCPLCLKSGILKLEWQVKEIEICDEHLHPLVENCPSCHAAQPFAAESWRMYQCVNCFCDLRACVIEKLEQLEPKYVEVQLKKIDDWRFLLDANENLFHLIPGFSRQQSLAILLLYITQNKKHEFNPKLNVVLPGPTISRLKSFITNLKDGQLMEFHKLLSLLRLSGHSLRNLPYIHVPKHFIDSLFDEQSTKNIGPCRTPWCKWRNEKNKMVPIKHLPHVQSQEITYIYHAVCTSCWIEHGQDSLDGTWKTIGDTVEITIEIRRQLEQGMTRHAIGDRLGIGPRKLYKTVGYLLQHRMVSEKVFKELCPEADEPTDLRRKFEDISQKKGSLLAQARKHYGWDDFTFYYLLASPSVQCFYLLEPHRKRGTKTRQKINSEVARRMEKLKIHTEQVLAEMNSEGTKISQRGVAEKLGTTVNTLRTYGLISLVNKARRSQEDDAVRQCQIKLQDRTRSFFILKREAAEPVRMHEVFEYLGYSQKYVKRWHPQMYQWICQKVRKHASEHRRLKIENYKHQVERAFRSLSKCGIHISNEGLAKEMGVSIANLFRNHPEVIEHMYKVRTGMVRGRATGCVDSARAKG